MYFKLHRKPLTKGGDLFLLVLIVACHPMKTIPISKYVICFLPPQTSAGCTLSTTDFVLLSCEENILRDLGFFGEYFAF